MTNAELEELAAAIRNYSATDFAELSRAEVSSGSATATFYWYPDKVNPKALVKVFVGDDAGSLYRQEITALYMLRATGRVCTVVCNSTKIQTRFWDEESTGLYFIAKLFYPKSFDAALRTATGLEKLDLAAQQVDIARLFLKLRWRDYDWRKENDVIEESSGRVLRVDLDSASSLTGFFEQKSTIGKEDFFSHRETTSLKKFLQLREDILKSAEQNEVRNMAIRLSHFIFIDENNKAELKDLIGELQARSEELTNPSGNCGSEPLVVIGPPGVVRRKARHFIALLRRGVMAVLKVNKKEDSQERCAVAQLEQPRISMENPDDIPAFDRWVDLWLSQAIADTFQSCSSPSIEKLSRLRPNELGLLARLFHHIISNIEHGFTLDDLHSSLVMLNASCIRDRSRRIARENWDEKTIKLLAPSTRFFEVRNTLQHPKSGTVKIANSNVRETRRTEALEVKVATSILKIESAVGRGFWPASIKEAQGKECEDRAGVFSNSKFVAGFVVDGVSDASGLPSAMIVQEKAERWLEELSVASPEQIEQHMRKLVAGINASLIAKHKETKEPHQAMFVMAVVSIYEDLSYAIIVKAGDNSECVVFNPDNSFRFSTKNKETNPRLGGVTALKDGDVQIDRIMLSPNVSYRFRLFSDGVGDVGFTRVREIKDIEQLVDEAEHWHELFGGAVGNNDDWAVSGFDVTIQESAMIVPEGLPAGLPEENSTAKSTDGQGASESLFEEIEKFDVGVLHMSQRAKEFWNEAIRETSNGRSSQPDIVFDLFRNAMGDDRIPPKLRVPEKSLVPVDVAVRDDKARIDRLRMHKFLLGLVVTLALVVLAFTYVIWWRSVPSNERSTSSFQQSSITPSSNSSPEVGSLNAKQRQILEDLKDRQLHIEAGFPGGETIDDSQFSNFLTDLAQVLITAKLQVQIEVYASPGGDPAFNLARTQKRADRIRETLLSNFAVPEKQILVIGRGLPPRQDIRGASIVIQRRGS